MRTYGLITHAAIDYAIFVWLILLPWIGGYAAFMWPSLYTIALALGLLFLALFTDYPGGAVKRLPFRTHQWIEWGSSILFILLPFYLFADAATAPMMKWLMSITGLVIVANTFFTRAPPIKKSAAQAQAPPPQITAPPSA